MKIILESNDTYNGVLDKLKIEIPFNQTFNEVELDPASFYYNWGDVKAYLTDEKIVKYSHLLLCHTNSFRMVVFDERSYRKMLEEVKEYWKDHEDFNFDYKFEENWEELHKKDLDNLYNHIDDRLKFYKRGLDVKVNIEEPYIYINLKIFNNGLSSKEFITQDELIRETFKDIFKEISSKEVKCYMWNSSGYRFNPNEPFKLVKYYEDDYEWEVDIIPNGDIQFFFLDDLKNIVYSNGVGGDKGIYLVGKDLVNLFKSKYANKFDKKYYDVMYKNI